MFFLKQCFFFFSLLLLNFQTQVRFVEAKRLVSRMKSMNKVRKDQKKVTRELSPKSYKTLLAELNTAEKIQRVYGRKAKSSVIHYDCRDKEQEITQLKEDYKENNYVLKVDSETLIDCIELNNVLRKHELKACNAWSESLEESEDENDDEKTEDKDPIGCIEWILIKLGIKSPREK